MCNYCPFPGVTHVPLHGSSSNSMLNTSISKPASDWFAFLLKSSFLVFVSVFSTGAWLNSSCLMFTWEERWGALELWELTAIRGNAYYTALFLSKSKSERILNINSVFNTSRPNSAWRTSLSTCSVSLWIIFTSL